MAFEDQREDETRRVEEVNKMDNHNSNNDNDTIIIINSAAIRSVLRNWIEGLFVFLFVCSCSVVSE